jgi:hypothetical protein
LVFPAANADADSARFAFAVFLALAFHLAPIIIDQYFGLRLEMIAPGFDPMQQVLFCEIELSVDRLFA